MTSRSPRSGAALALLALAFASCNGNDSGGGGGTPTTQAAPNPPPQQPGTAASPAPAVPAATAEFSGTYYGGVLYVSQPDGLVYGPNDVQIRLTQIGAAISGDFETQPRVGVTNGFYDVGTITGTVSGNTFTLSLMQNFGGPTCPNAVSTGVFTLVGDSLSGTLVGKCANQTVSETFTLIRQ